jgi:hypothetical protein
MHEQLFGPVKQWGFLVKNLDEAMACWVDQLGVGPWWGFRNVTLQSQFRGETTSVNINVGLAYQNGVQIELIEQTNRVQSPYRAFYDTPQAQVLHQVAYIVPDLDAAVARAKQAGMIEHGMVSNPQQRFMYMESPALAGLVVELMPYDKAFVAEYERCAKEAAHWDGGDPYRLVSF